MHACMTWVKLFAVTSAGTRRFRQHAADAPRRRFPLLSDGFSYSSWLVPDESNALILITDDRIIAKASAQLVLELSILLYHHFNIILCYFLFVLMLFTVQCSVHVLLKVQQRDAFQVKNLICVPLTLRSRLFSSLWSWHLSLLHEFSSI